MIDHETVWQLPKAYILGDRSRDQYDRSSFEDIVLRCVKYAFAQIPATIGQVFFSRGIALPFLRFRMLRNGLIQSPLSWQGIDTSTLKGVIIRGDEVQEPDIVILYCHGGGFAMGSAYFYLEFLLAWASLLMKSGYRNPVILGLEYSLVPQATFPTQLHEVVAGYQYASSLAKDSSKVCVAGDSAGGTLVLSLLLWLNENNESPPGFALLISPWIMLQSRWNQDSELDYLDAKTLEIFGRQYAGSSENLKSHLVSPGLCKDRQLWARACPKSGFGFLYGAREVLAEEIRRLTGLLQQSGCAVKTREDIHGVHAWPVVSLFLGNTQVRRQRGLKDMTNMIHEAIALSH